MIMDYKLALRVHSVGRSLNKPYSGKEIKFWKGESLKDKNLLVLGEQGIGDTMMFATLLSKLKERRKYLFLPRRSFAINLQRSFPELNTVSTKTQDRSHGPVKFDYQTPSGTICPMIR